MLYVSLITYQPPLERYSDVKKGSSDPWLGITDIMLMNILGLSYLFLFNKIPCPNCICLLKKQYRPVSRLLKELIYNPGIMICVFDKKNCNDNNRIYKNIEIDREIDRLIDR